MLPSGSLGNHAGEVIEWTRQLLRRMRPGTPFAGPKQVLSYLSPHTHPVAISNRRLVSTDDNQVAFRSKITAQRRSCARSQDAEQRRLATRGETQVKKQGLVEAQGGKPATH